VGYTLQDRNIQRLYANALGWSCNADSLPPVISMVVTPSVIWPPNHHLVQVAKGISATDAADPLPDLVVTVSSNEPSAGDPDWQIITNADRTVDVWVRAERLASGSGRVYTISATATDASDNASSQVDSVTVPKSKGAAPSSRR